MRRSSRQGRTCATYWLSHSIRHHLWTGGSALPDRSRADDRWHDVQPRAAQRNRTERLAAGRRNIARRNRRPMYSLPYSALGRRKNGRALPGLPHQHPGSNQRPEYFARRIARGSIVPQLSHRAQRPTGRTHAHGFSELSTRRIGLFARDSPDGVRGPAFCLRGLSYQRPGAF